MLALGFATMGCGKEAGRIPLSAEGAKEASFDLKAGDVSFWTAIDMEWEGDGNLFYQVDLVQNGKTVGTAKCDPLGPMSVKTSWVSTDLGSKHSRSGNGKMGCDVKLAAGGPTTVKVNLAWVHRPATVQLRQADLVVKQ